MIVRPEYITFMDWAANLVQDYSKEYLPVPEDESGWEEWAASIAGTGIFARNNIPAPFTIEGGQKKQEFKTWEDWAKVMYNLMINSSEKNV